MYYIVREKQYREWQSRMFNIFECQDDDDDVVEMAFADKIGEASTQEEGFKIMDDACCSSSKLDTLALIKGGQDLVDRSLAYFPQGFPLGGIYSLPWIFFVVNEKHVKYALPKPSSERVPVVGDVVCHGPYYMYEKLRDLDMARLPSEQELGGVKDMNDYIVFHDAIANEAMSEAMTFINKTAPYLYFESDTIPEEPTGHLLGIYIDVMLARRGNPHTICNNQAAGLLGLVVIANGELSDLEIATHFLDQTDIVHEHIPDELIEKIQGEPTLEEMQELIAEIKKIRPVSKLRDATLAQRDQYLEFYFPEMLAEIQSLGRVGAQTKDE
jgi:hypothetical protein